MPGLPPDGHRVSLADSYALVIIFRIIALTAMTKVKEDVQRAADIPILTGEDDEAMRLTSKEMETLIDEVCATEGRRGLMLRTLLETGVRIPELVALRVGDVSLEGRFITVRQPKSDRTREVPIPASLAQDFQHHIGSRKSDSLFQGPDGKGYTEQQVCWIVQATVERADINRDVGAQALRHVTATFLRDRGASLDYIRKVLGHTHSDVTLNELGGRFELDLC